MRRGRIISIVFLISIFGFSFVFGQEKKSPQKVTKTTQEIKIPEECLSLVENPCEAAQCKKCQKIIFPWFEQKVRVFNKTVRAKKWKDVATMFAPNAEGITLQGDNARKTPEEIQKIVGDANRHYGGDGFQSLCRYDLVDHPAANSERLFFAQETNFRVVGVDDCTVYQLIINGEHKGKFYSVSLCGIND